MREQLARWLEADKKISEMKVAIKAIEEDIKLQEREIESVQAELESIMNEDGLIEESIEGEYVNYKLYFTNPRGSVKCPDASAVPDEFCEIIRKPKLTEIKKHLDENQVNWATIEFNKPKLSYKVMKK